MVVWIHILGEYASSEAIQTGKRRLLWPKSLNSIPEAWLSRQTAQNLICVIFNNVVHHG